MFTTAEKSKTVTSAPQQQGKGTFFRKAAETSFFEAKETGSFFSPDVQPKLSVSQPDDPYEKEADQTADAVMRMPDTQIQEPERKEEKDIQRKAEAEEEELVQPKLMLPEISAVQRMEDSYDEEYGAAIQRSGRGPPAAVSLDFEQTLNSSKGAGSPMPETTKAFMEDRFNANFEGVRIHTGSTAETLSRSINAQAFTHGNDIYFNSGKYSPHTGAGGHLLAHELTHTIQQGASKSVSPKLSRKPMLQRSAEAAVPQLSNAVAKAKGEEGKVNANKEGPDGNREGWEHLIDYFKTTFGEDKIIKNGQPPVDGAVAEDHIKKKSTIEGPRPAKPRPADNGPYMRDAMPSWCGIFVFWALNKGGVPMPKWELGGRMVTPEAAYPPGYIPKAGDIAYRDNYSHYAIVEKSDGTTVTTVNGNTSGEDNLGAQVQTRDHPLAEWTAFFDPIKLKTGALGSGEGAVEEKPKTLRELRKELFNVNRKEEPGPEQEGAPDLVAGGQVQTKPTLSNWSVNVEGVLNHSPPVIQTKPEEEKLQAKEEEEEIIQRSWFDDAWSTVTDFVAESLAEGKRMLLNEARDFVMAIPGYRALRVVLGQDPITGEDIERNGHTFIEAAFDIMPGGRLLHEKLTELGALEDAANWIDQQITGVEAIVDGVLARVDQFIESITLERLADPRALFEEAGNIIHSTIQNIVSFAESAATELLETVKRFLLDQIVTFIREQTPAYPLLRVVLGKDPVTDEEVQRNGTTILDALLELGGEEGAEQRRQMQETGTFQKVAGWIDEGIGVFEGAYDDLKAGFLEIWDSVSIEMLMNPIDTFRGIYEKFAAPVRKVLDFVLRAGAAILQFIKEVLMQRLSAWARTVRGYHLVTVIIGKDPFTDEIVPFNMENVIRGFMSLMDGGDAQFDQLKESGAIERTTARITAAVERLDMTPAYIVQLFINLWNSFSLNDLADPVAAFERIIDRFGEPIGRLIDFVIEIVRIVIEVILEVMNFPTALIANIIAKAMQAFEMIKADPVGFLKNLLRAIKQGFIQFFDHIVQHLLSGLVAWLTSELKDAGVPELNDLSLRGVISWVLQILDITMEKIWEKLAAHPRIGPERVARIRSMINTLEGIWTFIKDVQERGIAAIWDKIQEQLSNLWDTILGAVKNWIMEQIVNRMVTRLLSMLDPTGIMAVVNSAIALYSAIQSFIKYLREMLEIVNSFVEGVVDIASGNIATAANYLERTLARAVPIVLGFLANQVGLSGIGHRVGEMIGQAREMVDQALTWLVNKAVDTGFAIFDRLMGRGGTGEPAPAVPNDPAAHRELANEAKRELDQSPVTATTPAEALQQKQTAARNLEQTYSARLQAPLRMTITLAEQAHTESMEQLGARIVIAPNDTVVEDTITVSLGTGTSPLVPGLEMRRRKAPPSSRVQWTNARIQAIGDQEGNNRTATLVYNEDARTAPITHTIPFSTLQGYIALPVDAVPIGGYALGSSTEGHQLYKPKDLEEINVSTGVTEFTYKTHGDASFRATVNTIANTRTVEGSNLQLARRAGVDSRGITQNPATYVRGLGLHRAHLIADRFMGTGFRSGQNLIITSPTYNLQDMSNAENVLANAVRNFDADTFDLTVSARLGRITTDAVINAITTATPAEEQAETAAEINAFAGTHANFDICLGVTYQGTMKKTNTADRTITAGPLGPDRYLRSN